MLYVQENKKKTLKIKEHIEFILRDERASCLLYDFGCENAYKLNYHDVMILSFVLYFSVLHHLQLAVMRPKYG